VIRGEGDASFTQLVEYLLLKKGFLKKIKGVSYRNDREIVENPRALIPDIESLSYPRRNLVNLARYKIPGVIQTTRGCPFQCRFCSAGAMAGGKYRMRSIESIMEEIDYLANLGIQFIAFSDDTITGFPEKTKQISYHFLRKAYSPVWVCESRVDVADRDLLRLMAQSGCHTIQFGFESGSKKILKAIKKNITPEQIENAIRLCLEFGIQATGNFMIGFPDDTRETIKETFDLARKIKKLGAIVGFAVLTPFPGTYIYNHAKELGMTIHSNDWDDFDLENPIISTKNLSLNELRTIFFDYKMEILNS
jgi:radical SAM superfamily enzyme YgiQ (UPF0313 family)